MKFTAREWRDRADDARAQVDRMRDPEAKRVMLSIAASYDRLAVMADTSAARERGGEASEWRVRAAAYRRMAGSAREVERERKLLVLAAEFEERANVIARQSESGRES